MNLKKQLLKLTNDLRKIPVIRVLFPFLTGILIAPIFNMDADPGFIPVIFMMLIIGVHFLAAPSSGHIIRIFMAILVFLFFISAGIFSYHTSVRQKIPDLDEKKTIVAGVIKNEMSGTEKYRRLTLRVKYLMLMDTVIKTRQNMVVYLNRDSAVCSLLPGEKRVFYGLLLPVKNRGNTGEFDYESYMKRRNCHFILFADKVTTGGNSNSDPPSLRYLPERIRQRLLANRDLSDPDESVLCALTLGYRSALDRETKGAFSKAGAMHLLAVSGLHIGTIWYILDMILRLPKRKGWQVLKAMAICIILWAYAAITGFSGSVTRSVTMFSLVTLSKTLQRSANIYNVLLLSAFILLVVDPRRIFDTGFQLSYLAVFGIVAVHPLLRSLYTPPNKLVKWIYDITAVSISAQFATLPLVLHYFNQFPVWSLLTNLVAIPIVSLIMFFFIISVPFYFVTPGFLILHKILLTMTHWLNQTVGWISELPHSVTGKVAVSMPLSLVMLGIMIMVILFLYYRDIRLFLIALLLVSMGLLFSAYKVHLAKCYRSIEIGNFSNSTTISLRAGLARYTCCIYSDTVNDPYAIMYTESLAIEPVTLAKNRIVETNVFSKEDHEGIVVLSDQLWAIEMDTISILIAGNCDPDKFKYALACRDWSMLIFRKGSLNIVWEFPSIGKECTMICDGTLSHYETLQMARMIPEVYICRSEGAYRKLWRSHTE
ncbi:MAG: competence protein ComEC family protein [Bacteroidales bacterium]|nr:competence protein ComEC family protein [Bacteroidales bacterium]